jgi:TetR/AcrR family transcriptional regulator, cholesterol catabolism regulator
MENDIIKDQIIRLSKELFLENGFSGITTELLAKTLSISKRTIYEKFRSKDEIISSVIDSILWEIEEHINSIILKIQTEPDINIIEQIISVWKIGCDASLFINKKILTEIRIKQPETWNRILDFRENQFKKLFFKISEKSLEQGYVRETVNRDVAYFIAFISFQNIISPEYLSIINLNPSEIVKSIYDILFNGILTEKGRAEYSKFLNQPCPHHCEEK